MSEMSVPAACGKIRTAGDGFPTSIDELKTGLEPLRGGSGRRSVGALMRAVVLLLILPGIMVAQTISKYAGEFLAIGIGGRALGMGGTSVAVATDATAGYWNPAGLASLRYPEIALMHDERFAGMINYDYGSVALPYGPDASLGISLIRLGIDAIPDTRDALIDQNGNGQLDPGDRIDYTRIKYFTAADWALFLTYAQQVDEDLAYGFSVKYIRRDLAEFSANGIGFDAGIRYRVMPDIYAAATLQDVTTTLVAWSSGRQELISPTVRLGAMGSFDVLGGRLTPALDADVRFENRRKASSAHVGPISLDPRIGLEFDLRNAVAFRVGYNDLQQATLGAGLHLRKLDVDYSFVGFGANNDLGATHRISLRLKLEEERFAREE